MFPKVFITGAQPGSGKSEIESLISKYLLNNVVNCNLDNFREFYPDSEKIIKENPLEYALITHSFAKELNDHLIDYCHQSRLNYIFETTLRDVSRLNKMMKNRNAPEIDIIAIVDEFN